MKTRLLVAPLLLALVASLAACGGGSSAVPSTAVALVNGKQVTLADYNTVFGQLMAQSTSGGQPKPAPGSPQYTTLQNQATSYLVQVEEVKQQAPKLHITVTPSEVTKFIANVIKTNYSGSNLRFSEYLKLQGLTMAGARQEVDFTLLARKIQTKVTSSAKASLSAEKAYYTTNITQYSVQAGTIRQVAHILVKTRSLANSLEKKLQHGAKFATLAQNYSTDTSSAANGGKLCVSKKGSVSTFSKSGTLVSCIQTVPSFSNMAFSLRTGQISAPVHSQYGFHVIVALGPVVKQTAHAEPFSKVQAAIKQSLLSTQRNVLWNAWLNQLATEYKGKVTYQTGYAPPTTTALSTTTG